jgi:hypothetical protein
MFTYVTNMKNTNKKESEGNKIKLEIIRQSTDICTSCGAAQNLFPTSATWDDLYWVGTLATLVEVLWESLHCSQMLMTHVFLDLTQNNTYITNQTG